MKNLKYVAFFLVAMVFVGVLGGCRHGGYYDYAYPYGYDNAHPYDNGSNYSYGYPYAAYGAYPYYGQQYYAPQAAPRYYR